MEKKAKSDPVAIKLALSHQLEEELNKTGFDYVVILMDRDTNPDVAVASNRSHTELPRLLRQLASQLETGGIDL
ncbi:MAG: hypothetical protein JNN15_15985 [Blastocatellia bacterium]|nr:hypothetical protein [Blastocatellia bacterium]